MSAVDVVVPCYRYGHFLRECVESVLKQEGVDVRLLIIDDASPDDSAEVGLELQREDRRVTFVRHNKNKGHIATYNEGINLVSSEYFLLLSADDYLLPGALARATSLMAKHPAVGFTFGGAIELNTGGATRRLEPVRAFPDGLDEVVIRSDRFMVISGVRNIVPTPTAVVRTSLQKIAGGYCPALPHSGDMEMWLRLAARAPVGIIRGPQAVYRRHPTNMSRAYTVKRWLPDLVQRKAAVDIFFHGHAHIVPEAETLRAAMMRMLSREALEFASEVFNDGDLSLCAELSEFAFTCAPETKRSLAALKLACKMRIGTQRWRPLKGAIARARQRIQWSRGRSTESDSKKM